jgi:hypothetical protein
MTDDIDVVKQYIFSYVSSNFGVELLPHVPKTSNNITLDVIKNNEIDMTFDKNEFLDDYLSEFLPKHDKQESVCESSKNDILENTQDNTGEYANDDFMEVTKEDEVETKNDITPKYDFILINGEDNLKKIIKGDDLTNSSSIFDMEPFMYKPILCEFLDNENNVTKIDFCDNNKSYDFLVVGNCFDKTFLTFFMKKYYDVDVKENYVLKILDNNVNTITFESCDIMKLESNSITKVTG